MKRPGSPCTLPLDRTGGDAGSAAACATAGAILRIRHESEGLGIQVIPGPEHRRSLAGVGGGDLVADLALSPGRRSPHAGQLHLSSDRSRRSRARREDDVRETQDVVDLVPGSPERPVAMMRVRARGSASLRRISGSGLASARMTERRPSTDHLGVDDPGRRAAHEHVGVRPRRPGARWSVSRRSAARTSSLPASASGGWLWITPWVADQDVLDPGCRADLIRRSRRWRRRQRPRPRS